MSAIRFLPVDSIHRRADARPLNSAKVDELAESIGSSPDRQPMNPLTVRLAADGWELIAGSHRLAAVTKLGEAEVICNEVDLDDAYAELAMIDENLIRSELGAADQARQTARRKELYEKLHPETRHGGIRQSDQVAALATCSPPRFITDTAAKTGLAERSISRHAERGKKIAPEALEAVRGTRLDKGSYLDDLKRVEPSAQLETVKQDLARPPSESERNPYAHSSGLRETRTRKPVPAREKIGSAADPNSIGTTEDPILSGSLPTRASDRVREHVEAILEAPVADVVAGIDRKQRALFCQRLSSLIDHANEILEALQP